jgi:hypothetical protein
MSKPTSTIEKISKTAVLAGAALALPVTGKASVIVLDGSPYPITVVSSSSAVPGGISETVSINGTPDFSFGANYNSLTDTVDAIGSALWLGDGGDPVALTENSIIGPGMNPAYSWYTGVGTLQYSEFGKMKGPWPTDNSIAYLGIEIPISGQMYYGWIGLSACTYAGGTTCDPSAIVDIVQAGYQNVQGQALGAGTPEPSTLALFALGAAGIAAFRLRRKRTA